ncbi:MAG: metal-sulfur cluster biosynthetic enzyme [Cenarchaeum symbiont of Oopsacas minuta]|nr:metal-sulfur cluster biosynthetic enzyme [Cenarchaeum symbiont of Oopsacas minuta]
MENVTPDAVRKSLKQCMDPEVPINIVDMGLIYGIDVSGSNVHIRMTMTTQGCPLHETMVQDVTRYAKKVPGVTDVKVEVVWDPPWTMEKLTDDARETLKKMGANAGMATPAPINYEIAMPQGVGNLVKQDDGSLVLANEHEQGFMVNDAIVEFWKMCNGKRKMTELVDLFAKHTGMQRGQVEKEVMQLIQQLRDGGLVTIPTLSETPNVEFNR